MLNSSRWSRHERGAFAATLSRATPGGIPNTLIPAYLPLWILAGYIALFIIRPWEILFPELGALRIERWYGVAMLIVVPLLAKPRNRPLHGFGPVLLFIAALGLTTAFGIDAANSWEALYSCLTVVVFCGLLIIALRSVYDLLFILACYIAVMVAYLAKAQWEYFVHGAYQVEQGVKRLAGIEWTFGDPNSLAPSVVFSLPFAVLLFTSRDLLARRWPAGGRKLLTFGLVGYFALAVTSVALTRSRSGMACLILFVALQALRGRGLARRSYRLTIGVLICLAAFLIAPRDIQDRFRTLWDSSAGPPNALRSAQGRTEGLRDGWEVFQLHPVVGIGPGNFPQYRSEEFGGPFAQTHSLVGQLLSETGLLGTLTFIYLVATTLRRCQRVRAALPLSGGNPVESALVNTALACRDTILLQLFQGLGAHSLYRFNWLWVFAFALLTARFTTYYLYYARQRAGDVSERGPDPRAMSPSTGGPRPAGRPVVAAETWP